jgi:ABC-2 type transport system permease protein
MMRLLALRIRNQFLDWAGAWWFMVSLVAGNLVGPFIGLAVWTDDGYFLALAGVQLLTASYENHTFAESVYDGRLGHELLKPQPVVLGPLGENIAIRLWHGVAGLPVIVVAAVLLGVSYRWQAVVLALPALLGAAVLRFLFTWLLALAAFWTERVHALVAFGNLLAFLLGGGAAPVAALPEPWRSVALASPFYAMLGLPADMVTGAAGWGGHLLWVPVLGGAAVVVWRAGVRRYTAVGA